MRWGFGEAVAGAVLRIALISVGAPDAGLAVNFVATASVDAAAASAAEADAADAAADAAAAIAASAAALEDENDAGCSKSGGGDDGVPFRK